MNRLTNRVDFIQNYLEAIFSEDLHAKRVKSLTNGTLGVMSSASLAVSIIGQSLAQARGLLSNRESFVGTNQRLQKWSTASPNICATHCRTLPSSALRERRSRRTTS